MSGSGRGLIAFPLLISVAWLWLHVIEWVVGHGRYAALGPLLTLGVASAAVAVAGSRETPIKGCSWPKLVFAAGLTVLLLVPQRLESEVIAGHGLASALFANHGWTTALVLGLALATGLAFQLDQLRRLLTDEP